MTQNKRLLSLDALRGFDMLFIMGFSGFVVSICKLFPGGEDFWLAQQMVHASWDGLRHHDTIFPLFLFMAGLSFPFSMEKSLSLGMSKRGILAKAIKRGIVLFLLGLVYGGLLDLDFATLRIPSVLGRIGIAWMLAAILYIYCSRRSRIWIAAGILIGYWLLNWLVLAPDAPSGASPFSMEGNIVCWIDRTLLGPNHIYKPLYDPEGILGTFPAAVTAMLGMFTGELVRSEKFSGNVKTVYMLAAAGIMLAVGLLWSCIYPINKSLWSGTFVLVVAAFSIALFAIFYWTIDVKGWKGWAPFFKIIGMNSITIYMAQRIIGLHNANNFIFGGFADLFPEPVAQVVIKGSYVLVCWLLLLFLYKHKIFLKV